MYYVIFTSVTVFKQTTHFFNMFYSTSHLTMTNCSMKRAQRSARTFRLFCFLLNLPI